jgi:6-pyruvoyltetrahydropterin/6-carboxytetrahydropterin synthase
MRIFIEDTFDAAHWLPNVPVDHKCHNLHGHTYHVRIEIEGEIGEATGWIVDYAVVKGAWDVVKRIVDHRNLNKIEGLENSTCELLAQWIWKRLSVFQLGDKLARLEVRETAHCGVVIER